MPILPLSSAAYTVQQLTLGSDSHGRYLSLVCPRAAAYALCFSSGAPIRREDLDLTDKDLSALCSGGNIQRADYRIQGVPRNIFNAMPVFRSFQAVPPEQIQVWSMDFYSNGKPILYVPDDPTSSTCYVPLRYTVQFTPGVYRPNKAPQPGLLQVRLLDAGQYADGALMYQVGDAMPIPLPEAYLNDTFIPILNENKPVSVVVSPMFQGKYVQA
ncbi:hypothetical protein H7U37_11690 [Pseudoflavonifractor phocaeensis]|uniref:hypothetical protein n=1 Tax=Pseudoflavonifractor phocaeensis TaxID=1870988 RepID=UPI00195C59D2|nr:hypothetical protein [Pseudoflavonifractor phocaeensis]MBM6871315.1 hypothetical protein [Pseudoflavonifractor phocaeensis]MBM6939175.1 hypothetical protein [Pseudoflavonifractor phocaeensis]